MINIFCSLKEKENLVYFKDTIANTIIIADKDLSSSAFGYAFEELTALAIEIHAINKQVAVKVDRLYEEDEIDLLIDQLKNYADISIDYIIYTDLAVKVALDSFENNIVSLYAPETLLTDYYDIKSLKEDGVKGCVISKDISLGDVYTIINEVPDYCYLRVHGSILIAYSRRRYIADYLGDNSQHLENYYLVEETRTNKLPIVEKKTGSWLYGDTLQSFSEINYLFTKPLAGIIIDNIIYDDKYTLDCLSLYQKVIEGIIEADDAYQKLVELYPNVSYTAINELRETWLEKEKA